MHVRKSWRRKYGANHSSSSSSSSSWMACLNAGPGRVFGSCLRPPRASGTPSKLPSAGRGDTRPIGGVPGFVRLDETLLARLPFCARAELGMRGAPRTMVFSPRRNPPKGGSIGDIPLLLLKNVPPMAGVWPTPPTYPDSSSTSTHSSSSSGLSDGRPVNTSRSAVASAAGDIDSTSIGRRAVRVCQPGGSRPHDFFQLERLEVLLEPVNSGGWKGVWRFCATNVVFPWAWLRRGVSSIVLRE